MSPSYRVSADGARFGRTAGPNVPALRSRPVRDRARERRRQATSFPVGAPLGADPKNRGRGCALFQASRLFRWAWSWRRINLAARRALVGCAGGRSVSGAGVGNRRACQSRPSRLSAPRNGTARNRPIPIRATINHPTSAYRTTLLNTPYDHCPCRRHKEQAMSCKELLSMA